ncbi:MAG: peptidylprolyl isomerase [Thiotrichales bacterium]|nr:peptidylprolyl isomerase [Thiotrichales bacterium]
MKRKLNAAMLSVLSLIGLSTPPSTLLAAEAIAPQEALVDKIVAVVNDRIILRSELNRKLLQKAEELRAQNMNIEDTQALRAQVLDSMILEAVQLSRAEQTGMKIADEELNQQMEAIAQQNNLSLLDLRNRLNLESDDGFNKLREQIRNQMLIQKLRQREVIDRTQITESEINNYLNRMTLANKYREIQLQHLLVALPESASQQQRKQALDKITKLRERLLQGEDFAQLAVRFSDGSRALDGGNLGWMQDSEVPTFFAKQVANLKKGEVSEIIQSPSGFHLVKIANERQAGTQQIDEFHLYRFLVLSDDALQQTQAPSSLIKIAQEIGGLNDFEALNQTFADIPKDVNANRDLGWIAQTQLTPELQSVLATLEVGRASLPLATENGWTIFYLDGVRTVNQDAQDKKEEAAQAVRARKANEMFDLWLRRLKDEAFIKITL